MALPGLSKADMSGGIETVEVGHGQVHEDDLRTQAPSQFQHNPLAGVLITFRSCSNCNTTWRPLRTWA